MIAGVAIPPVDDLYPWTAICRGLQTLGYAVDRRCGEDCDMLVTWSPWNGSLRQALQRRFEAAGKPVIVMENGWLSPLPFGPLGGQAFYQVALGGWNGTGRYESGPGQRWASWGIPLEAWTERTLPALVIGQRGGPDDARTAPKGWHETTLPGTLAVRRRPRDAMRPLAMDIAQAGQCHVWSSNAASLALVMGVPVVQHGPNLMVADLASRPGEALRRPNRVPVFEALAWAQFSKAELETGQPFARLLAHVS